MKLAFPHCIDRLPLLLRNVSFKQLPRPHPAIQSDVRQSSQATSTAMNQEFIDVSDEVQSAIADGKPIVTLESAIITHGMPTPTNAETAMKVQDIVREQGAVPATIAIVKGRIKVGIDDDTLNFLAREKMNTLKTSYRDLPYVISQKFNGGTTVSTTIAVSKALGIPVMVTGGIGGVHRGGESSMDISADLIELGCTPIGVVCSGAKSILDIERTLEYLETQGVMVATYGPTKDFPAFYSRRSGFSSPYNVETPKIAASLIDVTRKSQLRSGIVIAVPVPEEDAIPSDEMEEIIKVAVKEANEKGVRGKDITPFILGHVVRKTAGRSLNTNIALIKNNAKVGAQVAVELAKLTPKWSTPNISIGPDVSRNKKPDVVVVGGAVVDSITQLAEPHKTDGRSHLARIVQSGGGVGRNMADALGRLGARPLLLTAVGDDLAGHFLLKDTLGHLDTSAVQVVKNGRTAAYTLLLSPTGECHTGAGDMEVHERISTDLVERHQSAIKSSDLVVVDGNIPSETISYIVQKCHDARVPVWFEPTDIHKAAKPFESGNWNMIDFTSPNFNELRVMCAAAGMNDIPPTAFQLPNEELVEKATAMALFLAKSISTVIATLGHLGIIVCRKDSADQPFFLLSSDGQRRPCLRRLASSLPQARYYSAPTCQPVSVSGAGDCWNAGFISAALQGESEASCVKAGFKAALCSLAVASAVPTSFQVLPSNDNQCIALSQ